MNRPLPPDPQSVTHVDYGIFWLDLSGKVTRWSCEAELLFGYDATEATRLNLHDLFTMQDRALEVPERAIGQCTESGAWDGVGWRLCRDGGSFWAATSLTKVTTPNGLDIGLMAVTRKLDSTLTPETMAPDANRLVSLGRVATELSHDVRNILTAIRGFAGLLEHRLPPENGSYQLWHELVKACDRGADLTQRVLRVARSESDALGTLSLQKTLRSLEPMLRQIVPDRISLDVLIGDRVPPISAKAHNIELAVLNLVVNARDAIREEGAIRVELATEGAAEPTGARRVVLSISDSGEGMSAEIQDRIFERFFTTKGDGTGIGMAMVRDAVRASGGSIEIQSAQGDGTVVRLVFQPVTLEQIRERLQEAATPRSDKDGSNVILCFESPILSASVTELLGRAGLHVRVARDACHARTLLEEPGGATYVTDGTFDPEVDLPEMERACGAGDATHRRARRVRVILVREPTVVLSEAEARTVDRVLYLPLDPGELCDIVRDVALREDAVRVSIH